MRILIRYGLWSCCLAALFAAPAMGSGKDVRFRIVGPGPIADVSQTPFTITLEVYIEADSATTLRAYQLTMPCAFTGGTAGTVTYTPLSAEIDHTGHPNDYVFSGCLNAIVPSCGMAESVFLGDCAQPSWPSIVGAPNRSADFVYIGGGWGTCIGGGMFSDDGDNCDDDFDCDGTCFKPIEYVGSYTYDVSAKAEGSFEIALPTIAPAYADISCTTASDCGTTGTCGGGGFCDPCTQDSDCPNNSCNTGNGYCNDTSPVQAKGAEETPCVCEGDFDCADVPGGTTCGNGLCAGTGAPCTFQAADCNNGTDGPCVGVCDGVTCYSLPSHKWTATPYTLTIGAVGPEPPVSANAAASRYLDVVLNTGDSTPVAIKIRNKCSDEIGWVALTYTDYDDGAQGPVNVGTTAAACSDMEFYSPATWLGTGNKLVATGDIIWPDTDFEVWTVSGSCASPSESATSMMSDCTWPWGDCDHNDPIVYLASDILMCQVPNMAENGILGWTGPHPGYWADSGTPDGTVNLVADVLMCTVAVLGGTTWADVCGCTPCTCP